MELALRTVLLETERRVNWQSLFDEAVRPSSHVIGAYLSLRRDEQFVWLQPHDANQRLPETSWIVSESTRRLVPSPGSTVTKVEDLAALNDSRVIEIRQYRLVPGTRRRFTEFLVNRTLDTQRRCGMAFFGPFDDLEDENVATWFRGFPGIAERDRQKAMFYQGRYWLEELEREAFTMIEDYSNTMLVTPVFRGEPLQLS